MSEGIRPAISISDLKTTLISAVTEGRLTLNQATLGDRESTAYLLGFLEVDALTLTTPEIREISEGLLVSGGASFWNLLDLNVEITVTAPEDGVRFSLRATPSGSAGLQLPGFWLTVAQAVVAMDVNWSPSARSIAGSLSGKLRFDQVEVPISIDLPRAPDGFTFTGSLQGSARPSPMALAGLDNLSFLPSELGELLAVQSFKIVAGSAPYVGLTLATSRPWELIPGSLSLDAAELFVSVRKATANNPLSTAIRATATLRMGAQTMPIALAPGQDTTDWILSLDATEVALPSLTDLFQLFGAADQLESLAPGLGSFGALSLNGLRINFDPTRHRVTSLAFAATAQSNWSLPLFDGISFGRPTISLAVQGLGAITAEQPPYLAFRIASAQSWALTSTTPTLTLESVALFVGVTLATERNPRSVSTRLEAAVKVGDLLVPVTLEASPTEWVFSLFSTQVPLPGLADLADFFGGKTKLEEVAPGLDNFGALALTSLQLRMNPTQRKLTSMSLGVTARTVWKLPLFDEIGLRRATLALSIADPLGARSVTGSISAVAEIGDLEFEMAARKDAQNPAWRFEGRQIGDQPLSLTALGEEFIGGDLPSGVPQISFADIALSFVPSSGEFTLSGRSAAPWKVPLGPTELPLSNVRFAVNRTLVNGRKKNALQLSGDLGIGGGTASLALNLPGAFVLSTSLPEMSFTNVLRDLGGGSVLDGLGLSSSFFNLAIGASTLKIDAAAKSAVLATSAQKFDSIELQLKRDSQGKMGAALALKPKAGENLQDLLGVPGLGQYQMADLVFALSSINDPQLRFTASAFSALGSATRGFGFATKISIAELGVGNMPGLPTAPIAVQARFGSTLADFRLVAAMSQPGGRFVLDPKSGLALIDPELRISPAGPEVAIAGKLEVFIDGKKLDFTGGFKVTTGAAVIAATMKGDWERPFGLSGVVVRDISLGLGLPGLPRFAGTLQIGRTTGSVKIIPDPAAPVFEMSVDNIDLHDLITSVCDPALANLPAEYRQLIGDVRIANAQIYMAPRDRTDDPPCPAGVKVAGLIYAWGLTINGKVQTVGSGPLKSLLAEGSVNLPSLGGLLVLRRVGATATTTEGPYFKLDLQPGKMPVCIISAEVEVLGTKTSSVDIRLNDAGFKIALSGKVLGKVKASFEISGGKFSPQTKYSVAAELDTSDLSDLLGGIGTKLQDAIDKTAAEIGEAKSQLDSVKREGVVLQQEAVARRQQVQDQRDADAATLREAEGRVQGERAQVDALLRSLATARATVQAERDEVDRKIAAAQRDVNAANTAVQSIQSEINSTDSWFYGLPKVDAPWNPSQAREGIWFGLKMAGLYTARESAQSGLSIANSALAAVRATVQLFDVDLDPRVAAIKTAHATAALALQTTESTIRTLRDKLTLLPIDADFRLVALKTAQQVLTVQIIAAQAAFDLATSSLKEISGLSDTFKTSIRLKRTYFAGELEVVNGGRVRLGLEISTETGDKSFAVDVDLNKLVDSAGEILNRILGTNTSQAIAAVAQSTTNAQGAMKRAVAEAFPTGSTVLLRARNGRYLRVAGKNVVRYMGVNSLTSGSPPTRVYNGTLSFLKAGDNWSSGFVRYGDSIHIGPALTTFLSFDENGYWKTYKSDDDTATRLVVLDGNGQASGALVTTDTPLRLRMSTGRNIAFTMQPFTLSGPVPPAPDGTYSVSELSEIDPTLILVEASENDPQCWFRLDRWGDWVGLYSEYAGKYVAIAAGQVASATQDAATAPSSSAARFRMDGSCLYHEGTGRYLCLDGNGFGILSNAQEGDAAAIAFSLAMKPQSGDAVREIETQTLGATNAWWESNTPTEYRADDLSIATAQKSALAAQVAAASGPEAERKAAEKATAVQKLGDDSVLPVRLALVQGEDDRRARRERAIEKAAHEPRQATAEFRDGALRFDGKSYLEAPATRIVVRESASKADVVALPIIALSTSFTVEAWVCLESIAGDGFTILSKWDSITECELLLEIINDGRLILGWRVDGAGSFGTPGWNVCLSDEAVKLDGWSHVAAVRDGDKVSLYIDGRSVGGASGLGTAPLRVSTSSWRIGARSGSQTNGFIGTIDSIRIWDEARSAAALRGQRYLIARGSEDKLLASWNFDEVSGNIAFDASKNELHARMNGQVYRAAPGAPEGPPLPDRYLTFGGSGNALVGDVDLFGGSIAMSIEAWIRVDSIGDSVVSILNKWAQSIDDEVLFGFDASGKLIFAWHSQDASAYGTAGWNHSFSDGALPLGRWCHVAVVRDGKSIRFYCDGMPIGQSTAADEKPLRRGTAPVYIGSEAGARRFLNASLAELRVWRRAITEEEIREHRRRPLAGDESGLAALWRLDEGFGTKLRDATASAYHATITGGGAISWPARGGPPLLVGPTSGMRFSGSQYIDLGDDDWFSPGVAMTIESWVYVDSIDEEFTSIVNKWAQTIDDEYLFGLMTDGRLVFAWHNQGTDAWGTAGWNLAYSEQKLSLKRYTHLAVVRASKTVSFFIDGQPAGSAAVADDKPFHNGNARLRIGAEAGLSARYLRGTLAGLRMWRSARTQEQLSSAMYGLVPGRAPGRILDLRFDEGEGTTIRDAALGRLGNAIGQPAPSFVALTLPVRAPMLSASDPIALWLQPAFDAAKHCQLTGISAVEALFSVELTLAQLERAEHGTLVALLARAGYAPAAIGAACLSTWGIKAADVAPLFRQGARPAAEALLASAAVLTSTGAAAQAEATTWVNAAGYAPEELGNALLDVWDLDAAAVAKLCRDASLSCVTAARATFTALARHTAPCFAALVELLLSTSYLPSAVGAALKDHWGCDPSSIARAVRRAGGSVEVATAVLVGAYLPIVTGDGRLYQISDFGDLLVNCSRGDGTFAVRGMKLGSNWGGVKRIGAAPGGHLYAILNDGALRYYHHDEHGGFDSQANIGNGWGDFRWVGVGRFGQLYVLNSAGELLYHEHNEAFGWWRTGERLDAGWGDYVHVAAGGDNSLYAVTTSGALLHCQHDAALNWVRPPRKIADGFTGLSTIMASGDGGLYALKTTGELLYYRHLDDMSWLEGSGRSLDKVLTVVQPQNLTAATGGSGQLGSLSTRDMIRNALRAAGYSVS